MAIAESIKVINAALDEAPGGEIILRGVISPTSLKLIKFDDYQRETLPLPSLRSLIKAITANSPVPDVTLGMRGGDYLERDGAFYLRDSVFGIDGLQRITSALHVIQTGANSEPRLGCTVRFNTNKESESELFTILNTRSAKLSPNVLIRNLRETNPAIESLFNACTDKDFALFDRVSWQQRMRRHELISAMTLLKTICYLHSTFAAAKSVRFDQLAASSQRLHEAILGRRIFIANTKCFFDVIDGAWGVRSISWKDGATHLKGGFLLALSQVFAQHRNFWDDNHRLIVTPDLRRKLASFKINDPQVAAHASGNNRAQMVLRLMLVEHLNSGKRTKRLVPFKPSEVVEILDDEAEVA